MTSLADWNTFASAQTSAAATLTGLVFIGVSINVRQIISAPGLSQRAAESIIQFLQIFFVSAAMLIPGLSLRLFGVLCFACGAGSAVLQAITIGHSLELYRTLKRRATVTRTALVLLCTLPFCVAGIGASTDHPGALYWTLPGIFFSYVGGLIGAWVMIVEILR